VSSHAHSEGESTSGKRIKSVTRFPAILGILGAYKKAQGCPRAPAGASPGERKGLDYLKGKRTLRRLLWLFAQFAQDIKKGGQLENKAVNRISE